MVVLGLCFASLLCVVGYALFLGIGPNPTSPAVKRHLIKLVPRDAETIVDLGSGFGGLVASLSKQFPQKTVRGVELSPLPYIISRLRLALYRNAQVRREDAYTCDLQKADVVVCYLFPKAMKKVAQRLEKLDRGVMVITHTFALPGHTPTKTVYVDNFYKTPIYCYHVQGGQQ